jgi:phenylacetate-CoA ligase
MTFPTYFQSFDPAKALRDFTLGPEFARTVVHLSRDAMRARQEAHFRRCVARAWEIPFYQRLWRNTGLESGDIRGLDDLERLPIFSKSDLMKSLAEHPPYGDYHGWERWPLAERPPVVLHTTSGTTGRPQVVVFSPKSREVQAALVARCWHLHGIGPGDVIHSVYGHGMINGGHFVREAATHYTNCLFLSAGTGKETRSITQVEMMRDLKATALVGFVDYIRQLAEVARTQGLTPGEQLSIRVISGHVGRESRDVLSRAWGGAKVFDWYGVADTGPIAAEAQDQDGLYVFEDAHVLEVIDPETGQTVTDSNVGDMVVTSLYKDDIYPLIRFNTHDLTSWQPGRSSLDWNLRRISGVLGRSDNMVKLRGINVYPLALAQILNERPEFAGEYVCRAYRTSSGRDELLVFIEVRDNRHGNAALRNEFTTLLAQRIGVELQVELLPTGGTAPLTEIDSRQKPRRLIDERP